MDLSIVVPCYNEEKNISLVLERFAKAKPKTVDFELILVDNNSKDNSSEVLKTELAKKKYSFATTVFQEKPGYGNALQKGLSVAKGEFVGWTHGDIQTPPEDCFRAYELLKAKKNSKMFFAKGKRYGRPFLDKFFTIGMSGFESLLFGMKFWDINAQPNIFHKSLLKKLLVNAPGDFSFDLYAYYLAHKAKIKVLRFPVHFGVRVYGESTWNSGLMARIKFIKRTINFSLKLKKKV